MTVLNMFLKDKRAEISELKQKRKKLELGGEKVNLDELIEKEERLVRQFMRSKMEPRKVGSIVINYKLYCRFMKKLKRFRTKITINKDSLILQYGKTYGEWTGKLELFDLSKHFEGYPEVPKADIRIE